MKILPGDPAPLGATWDGHGVNFAIVSDHATRVVLCLFDSSGARRESAAIPLPERSGAVWHGYVPGLRPGALYGYRVHGHHEPAHGHRMNPNKLLLDPYARAIGREPSWCDELFGYTVGDPEEDLSFDERDSAPFAALGQVAPPMPRDEGPPRPRTPWDRTVIYELHVRGFTRLHPGVAEPLRGTYAGLASPAAIEHMLWLGVTAVEILPVHGHLDERRLVEQGLVNYWGYNTLAFFAPDPRLAASRDPIGAIHEFRDMVGALHAAGLEVILDVVYNHTPEGSETGPTLSFRGIDNATYYRLRHGDRRRYDDVSGCGNTLDARSPHVQRLILDSLRYWSAAFGVDGFRFDLATALGRDPHGFDPGAALLDAIHQDPELAPLKLIAEPWDVGPGGFHVGEFPAPWAEWNARYRDAARRFWRGDGGAGELACRMEGSPDLYDRRGRRPWASVNFVTSHDGFTLADLVAYEKKHNEANGEGNRDGENHNLGANHGVEGPSDDPDVIAARALHRRNLAATLLVSRGTPMIVAGDEMGRSQEGNNNAYCQDGPISWIDWNRDGRSEAFLEFVRSAIALRAGHPSLRAAAFPPRGRGAGAAAGGPILFDPSGLAAERDAIGSAFALLMKEPRDGGTDEVLILVNGGDEETIFATPKPEPAGGWVPALATGPLQTGGVDGKGASRWSVPPGTLVVLVAAGEAGR